MQLHFHRTCAVRVRYSVRERTGGAHLVSRCRRLKEVNASALKTSTDQGCWQLATPVGRCSSDQLSGHVCYCALWYIQMVRVQHPVISW